MKLIQVSHPLSGFEEADLNTSDAIRKHIGDKYFGIVVGCTTAYNREGPVIVDNELQMFPYNMMFMRYGTVDELWLYGDHIDEHMEKEINLAYAMRIPIVTTNNKIDWEYRQLGFVESEVPFKLWKKYKYIIMWLILFLTVYIVLTIDK